MATSPSSERLAPYVAALAPLLLYAWTAAGHGFWLDSPEFTAAAVGLDIPHPPGHPLFALWSKPFTWLPLGPLPYRVAMGQAVASALALACVQRAIARSLGFTGLTSPHARTLLSLGASWLLAGSYAFWFQSTRAEVYALQAMLVCFALERLTVLSCRERGDDPRPFFLACLALGLGLANHHFIAVLAMPALGYALVPLVRARGARVIALSLVSGALGLVCYAYLPLRAATLPLLDLGHPVTLRDFFWVVSAQVYARNIGSAALQPLDERLADLVVIVVENFTWPVLPLALLGGYALLRTRRTWPLAYLWLVTVLISLCGRAYLNPVRGNPDVLGYMMPGFAALLALAALGVGALLTSLPRARARERLILTVTCLLCCLAPVQVARESARSSLRGFHASDVFDDLRRRALPAHALVVLTTPDVVFRHWEGEVVEQLRRDVTLLPLPFVGYGASEHILAARDPALRGLIAHYQQHGDLRVDLLRALARDRPVYVELDTSTMLALWPYVVPDGLLYRVLPEAPDAAMRTRAVGLRERAQGEVLARLGDDLTCAETRRHLVWVRYVEALQLAWSGARAQAQVSTAAALSLSPGARELELLQDALREPARGAFVLTPFLPPRQTARAPHDTHAR